jgi:hypothetical protein
MPFYTYRQLGALLALASVFYGTVFAQGADDDLKIIVIEGEGFVNNLKHRTARDPVVEVRDRNRRPVAGALVTFAAPQSGPGATFNGASSITVTTDSAGRATATGFQPNQIKGRFQINIEARSEGRVARASIQQRNVSQGRFLNSRNLLIAAGIIAAIAIFVVVARAGNHDTGVSVGQPTVGPR